MTEDQMYQALIERDKAYDGAFYACVKTTGIFCRTVCSARKPKRENVVFYKTIQEAMAAGYRACKVCHPMEALGDIPPEMAMLIQEVEHNPNMKIKEGMIRDRGLDPAAVRRWFQKQYGMSFQAFCRMQRINLKFGEGAEDLKEEINASSEKPSNKSLSESSKPNTLLYERFDTPLGPMITIATEEGICLLEFGDRRMLETELIDLQKRLKAQLLPGRNQHIIQLLEELDGYYKGTLKTFTVPLVTPGTAFQNQVWEALKEIPYGEIESYQQMAQKICNPNAVRAVGRANGMNRIGIIIPCHRVIGADGQLTGYGGGLWRKEWLLEHERKNK